MAKINFGGVEETVVTREEFPLAKARKVLKDEVIAVLGYGVQGPAQSLNMRDNGVQVIIGQRKADKFYWDKAVEGRLGAGQDALRHRGGRRARHHHPVPRLRRRADDAVAEHQALPDRRQGALFLPRLLHRLQEADEGDPAEGHGRDPGRAEGLGHQRAAQLPGRERHQQLLRRAPGRHRPRAGALPGPRHRHRLRLPLPDHLRAGSLQRPDRRARRADGLPGGRDGGPVQRTAPARPQPSEAFNETVEELTQSLIRLVGENGMDWMYANCSTTAQRGALDWAPKFREAVDPVFEDLYHSVKTGNETAIVLEANSRPDYREKLGEELQMRESEMWRAGSAVRKLRPENWKKAPPSAGNKTYFHRRGAESAEKASEDILRYLTPGDSFSASSAPLR